MSGAPGYKKVVLPIRLLGIRNVHITVVGRGQMSDLESDEGGISAEKGVTL